MSNGKNGNGLPSWLTSLNRERRGGRAGARPEARRGASRSGAAARRHRGGADGRAGAAPQHPPCPSRGGAEERAPPGSSEPAQQEIKGRVHRKLLERLNLTQIDALEREPGAGRGPQGGARAAAEGDGAAQLRGARGAGHAGARRDLRPRPARAAAQGPEISDILVNTCNQVSSSGTASCSTDVRFKDDRHLLQIIDRIVSAWAGASTSRRRWWTRGCRTAPA
jgi:hypothetical protein